MNQIDLIQEGGNSLLRGILNIADWSNEYVDCAQFYFSNKTDRNAASKFLAGKGCHFMESEYQVGTDKVFCLIHINVKSRAILAPYKELFESLGKTINIRALNQHSYDEIFNGRAAQL